MQSIMYKNSFLARRHAKRGGGCRAVASPPHKTKSKKDTDFVNNNMNVSRDLPFSGNGLMTNTVKIWKGGGGTLEGLNELKNTNIASYDFNLYAVNSFCLCY